MKRLLLAGAAFQLALGSLGGAETREPRFLSFSAKDNNGIFLRDLKREEVTLLLNDQPVEVRYFGYRDVDTAIAFFLENSPRTAPYGASLPQFGRINIVDQVRYYLSGGFLQNLTEKGAVMIAEFDLQLRELQNFTSDEYLLDQALNQMKPNAGILGVEEIPLGRIIGRGVDILKKRAEKRKILVLFTTTVDRESVRHIDEYQQMLRLFDVDLYVVSFAPRTGSSIGRTHAEQVNTLFFRRLTEETSGRLYLSGDFVYLNEFMDDLLVRLDNSYTLGFYFDPDEEQAEYDVEVRIDRPKCNVTYRKKLVF